MCRGSGAGPRCGSNVKIGVLNDLSGTLCRPVRRGLGRRGADGGGGFQAADNGIKVEIVSADHQNKPDIGSNIARQW